MATLDEMTQGTPLGKLFAQDSPDASMALLNAGLQMLQPQQCRAKVR